MRKVIAIAASLVSIVLAVPCSADPAITFSDERVMVNGLTPGEGVFQLVVTRQYPGYRRVISADADHSEDRDRTGSAEMTSGGRVPQNSIWIAVDPKTGGSTVATPRPQGVTIETKRLNPGQLRLVSRDGLYAAFLWVRPGVGAWFLEAEDSGRYDDDPTPDGKLAIDVGRMAPVGDSPSSPHQLAPGDVVFAVDVLTLSVLELR